MMHWKLKLVLCGLFLIWLVLFAYVAFTLEWNGMKNFVLEKLNPLTPSPLKDNKPSIHVVLAADRDQSGGLVAAINSIVSNTGSSLHFHIITSENEIDHIREWIKNSKLSELSYTIIPFSESWLKEKSHVKLQAADNIITYARLYIPDLLPDIKGRAIYIDNDVIVQGDIFELFNGLIKKDHFGAFSEDCQSVSKQLGRNQNHYGDFLNFNNNNIKKLNLKLAACSFNTGVFVLDFDKWRSHNLSRKANYWLDINAREDILSKHYVGDAVSPIMMILLYKKISNIDPMWHVRHLGLSPGSRYSQGFLLKAKLLHWDGPFKPWKQKLSSSDLWLKYFIQDPTGKFKLKRRKII